MLFLSPSVVWHRAPPIQASCNDCAFAQGLRQELRLASVNHCVPTDTVWKFTWQHTTRSG